MSKRLKLSPPLVLLLYTLIALVLTFLYYRFLQKNPLIIPPFEKNYAFYKTAGAITRLFPALALSALVLWFSLRLIEQEGNMRFSPRFLETMRTPLITALLAATIFASFSLFIAPLTHDRQRAIEAKSKLYHSSLAEAERFRKEEAFGNAQRHFEICLSLWPNNEDLIEKHKRNERDYSEKKDPNIEELIDKEKKEQKILIEGKSLDLLSTIELSRSAFQARDYLSSHWFASLAINLAKEGSPEEREARRLQSEAWNHVAAIDADIDNPSDEKELAKINRRRLKLEGYTAYMAGETQRAYYIFTDLINEDPTSIKDDPDIKRYYALVKNELERLSFFSDEPQTLLGDVHHNIILSLPGPENSRDIIRAESMRIFSDAAWAENWEHIRIDANGRELFSLSAPRAKILPLPSGELATLLVVIDREKEQVRSSPVWRSGSPPDDIASRVIVKLDYADFIRLVHMRQGLEAFSFSELFKIRKTLSIHGYNPKNFLLNFFIRISEPFTFLALSIIALSLGWHFRARLRPGPLVLPVVIILPFIADIIIQAFRIFQISILSALVVFLPETYAFLAIILGEALFVSASIIFLAGQRA